MENSINNPNVSQSFSKKKNKVSETRKSPDDKYRTGPLFPQKHLKKKKNIKLSRKVSAQEFVPGSTQMQFLQKSHKVKSHRTKTLVKSTKNTKSAEKCINPVNVLTRWNMENKNIGNSFKNDETSLPLIESYNKFLEDQNKKSITDAVKIKSKKESTDLKNSIKEYSNRSIKKHDASTSKQPTTNSVQQNEQKSASKTAKNAKKLRSNKVKKKVPETIGLKTASSKIEVPEKVQIQNVSTSEDFPTTKKVSSKMKKVRKKINNAPQKKSVSSAKLEPIVLIDKSANESSMLKKNNVYRRK